jgi:glycosyltransferase involved in cell wall biosynthesis
MKPRILYLSPHSPDGATGASEMRSRAIARALKSVGHVEFIVVGDPADAPSMPAIRSTTFDVTDRLTVRPRPNATFRAKLRWLAAPRSIYPHGCGVGDEDMQRAVHAARECDLVWFFKLRTPNMFPGWSWDRSVVDIDDIPSAYEHTALKTVRSARERCASLLRAISWQRRERRLGDRFSVLGVCSDDDKQYLRRLGVSSPVHVIPNGFDAPVTPPARRPATPPRIGFMGIFDYEPNRQGLDWFVRTCWPRIKQAIPDARLRLVGRDSDGPLKPEGPDIDGLGWIPDPAEEIASWSHTIVPIRIGAGTRGKIAHAFGVKCPVVSTPLGAYGYDVHSGVELLLADSSSDFAGACIALVREPAFADAIAERAWQRFLVNWTWEAIQPRIWAAAEDALRRARERRPGHRPSAVPLRVHGHVS